MKEHLPFSSTPQETERPAFMKIPSSLVLLSADFINAGFSLFLYLFLYLYIEIIIY